MKLQNRIFNLIRDDDENDLPSKIFDGTIVALIIVNIVFVVLDTFHMPQVYTRISDIVEYVSVIVFSIEYVLRLWVAPLYKLNESRHVVRLKYAFSFMAIIDLLAVLPFYLAFLPIDLRILRALRIVRLLRLFKVNRYTTALSTIGKVFKRRANQLISSLFVVLILMLIASVLMVNVENATQPELFENAFSGFWWAIATLTTVGYGDIYPVTLLGKLLGGVIALLGIGIVAIPSGIISAGFVELMDDDKALPVSQADEILKFKNLLDAGAITNEEYEEKKKQLLDL